MGLTRKGQEFFLASVPPSIGNLTFGGSWAGPRPHSWNCCCCCCFVTSWLSCLSEPPPIVNGLNGFNRLRSCLVLSHGGWWISVMELESNCVNDGETMCWSAAGTKELLPLTCGSEQHIPVTYFKSSELNWFPFEMSELKLKEFTCSSCIPRYWHLLRATIIPISCMLSCDWLKLG